MFNDRDLFVVGVGAFLSLASLLLPLPFSGKLAAGAIVLACAILLALLRLGPDRISPEEWLRRRIRFSLKARRFVYQRPGYRPPEIRMGKAPRPRVRGQILRRNAPEAGVPASPALPMAFTLESIGVYRLASLLLIVLGAYFLAWLGQGGAVEVARLFSVFR